MSDRESRDVRTAAYLARTEEMPPERDGPSRAELAEEAAEQREFERQWRLRGGRPE